MRNRVVLQKMMLSCKLGLILVIERNRLHGQLLPVQMASLPSRDDFALCPLVPAVSAQLSRPGGDDARARGCTLIKPRFTVGYKTMGQSWRSADDPISMRRTTRGGWMRHIKRFFSKALNTPHATT